MILSKFNIYYDIVGKSGKVAVFNTLSKQIACFDKTVLDNIHDIPYVSDFPILHYLKNMNVVSDTVENDQMLVRKLHDKIATKSYKLYLVVIPSYKCNLKCMNCSSSQRDQTIVMNDGTLNSIFGFVDRFENISYMDFIIKGGEPLLLKEGLFDIVKSYHKRFAEKKFVSNVGIVTNGTLLSVDTIMQLEKDGVTSIIIDLEGLQDTYIARRNFIDGKGAYSALLETIMSSLLKTEKIIFTFNVSYRQDNLAEIMLFLNSLQTVLDNRRIKFSIHQSYNSPDQEQTDAQESKNARKKKSKKAVDLSQDMIYTSECLNNIESTIHSRYGVCHAKGDWMFAVDPKGDIYKCINGVGLDRFKIGNVGDDISIIYTSISKWNKHVSWCKSSGCYDCKLLPLCFGGCLYEQHLNVESHDSFGCKKDYFMTLIKTKVSKQIRNKVTEIQDIKC